MSEIKRYVDSTTDAGKTEAEQPYGDYVLYTDHIAEVQELESKLSKAEAIIKKYEETLELAEKELFRFNCDAPLNLTVIEKPVYLIIRQALAEGKKMRGEV